MNASEINALHTPADVRGLPAAPASVVNPLEEAFEDMLDELIEFVAEDAIHSGSAIPGGRGCYGPDTKGMEDHLAAVIAAARAAFAPVVPSPAPVVVVDSGLFTLHNPDTRRFVAIPGAAS